MLRRGGKPLPYEYSMCIRDKLLDIYISGGRKEFSKYLDINDCGAGHLLKYLGFYDKSIQKIVRESEIKKLKEPRCLNPFRPFNDISAYILGFIVGDGCITSRNDGRVLEKTLDISCNDKQIIRDIGVYFGFGEDKIYETVYSEGYKSTYSIFTDDFTVINDLIDFGIKPRKSKIGCNISFNKDYYSNFLRGLFDADGCVDYASRIGDRVRLRINICGHKSYLEDVANNTPFEWKCKFKDNGLSFIELFKQDEIKRLYEYMYNDSNLKLERKWMRFYECFVNGRRYEQYRIYRV